MSGGGLELAVVFLLAAVIAVPVFRRFGLGAVLGYLAAGVVLGPFGLRVIRDAEPVLAASEIGVVMMLFVIGLELSPSRLKVMRRPVFGVGGAQMLITGVVMGVLATFAGFGWKTALVVGLGLALSSTAVGLQLLSERKALGSEHGRLAFAILLFQDLTAIPLLAAIPLLGKANLVAEGGLGWDAIAKAAFAMAALVLGGRFLLRHLFRFVARSLMPEVFTGAALLVVLGSALLMQSAGLSAGLGAFLAGVLLADSEFRHELEAQIEPFKGLLLGLFFMAVGMSVDLKLVVAEPVLIELMVLALMVVKFAILVLVGIRPGKLSRRDALQLASVLAVGGEFAFVVFAEAVKAGLLDAVMRDRLVAAVGVSMALTPVLMIAVARILRGQPVARPEAPKETPPPDGHPQVLIAGFGRFGQIVARMLVAQKVPFIAIEHSADQVDFMRRFGNPLFYGDPAKPELLRSAGAKHVKVFVIAIDDPEGSLKTVRVIRRLYPEAKVCARARDRRHAWQLRDLGAYSLREMLHSSLKLGEEVLIALGVPPDVAHDHALRFLAHDERLLEAQYRVHDDPDAVLQASTLARRELEQLFDADLGEGVLGGIAGSPRSPEAR
ncbi:monovalent cation:proton antiporter-2 (CPA2) family protein [Novilysobacter antarcticus]|uniref:monovalent cation:proton antiporter-2 (CPA2) family protein n=1 Tax=Novilysobacter antarcticus TaxID=2862543 RepID=UPI001C995FBE|nr:monovalent cation:proton antiporter-2 (CPA2) family protein [Lysobacter antarcticus]